MIPIQFSTQTYESRSKPLSAQQLVNYYPERAPQGSEAQFGLMPTPGLNDFVTAGSGPIRGMHRMGRDGSLFSVSADTLYRLDSNGSTFSVGTVLGSGPVKMADNGTQLLLITGFKGYLHSDASPLALIADTDFPGDVLDCAYLDGYFIVLEAESGRFYVSSLLAGSAWDPLDFATAEASPDDGVAVLAVNRLLWLFGRQSTEVWYNSGNADFPFERVAGAVMEVGAIAPEGVARLGEQVYWVGAGLEGGIGIYRSSSSFQATRISTPAIDKVLEETPFETICEAVGFAYAQENHSFYVVTIPGVATFCYDATTGQFHERASRGSQAQDLLTLRYLRHAFAFGRHYVGDYENGKIYEMSLDARDEAGTTVRRVATTGTIHAQHDRAIMNAFVLDIEAGGGLASGQGSDPQAMLQFSDDGGRTWSNELWRGFGKRGQYGRRAVWRRLGQFRDRIIRVAVSDAVPHAIIGGYADIEVVSP